MKIGLLKGMWCLFPLLLLPVAGSAAGCSHIEGRLVRDGKSPVPGALVALYDQDKFFLSSTYTDTDGGFRISTDPGDKFLCATHGSLSKTIRLTVSNTGTIYTAISLTEERSLFQRAYQELANNGFYLATFVGATLGGFVSLLLSWWNNRRERKQLRASVIARVQQGLCGAMRNMRSTAESRQHENQQVKCFRDEITVGYFLVDETLKKFEATLCRFDCMALWNLYAIHKALARIRQGLDDLKVSDTTKKNDFSFFFANPKGPFEKDLLFAEDLQLIERLSNNLGGRSRSKLLQGDRY